MRLPGSLTLWTSLLFLLFSLCWKEAYTSSCTFNRSLASWFKEGDLYYIVYNAKVRIGEARCLCSFLPDARLAVFDDMSGGNRSAVEPYLLANYPNDQFWVDAQREQGGNSNYVWSNNCTLPIGTSLWKAHEPANSELYVRMALRSGSVEYMGIYDKETRPNKWFKPLCQSERAPFFDYLPPPPVLTWVRLGTVGHLFGFSRDTRTLSAARDACKYQAGTVSLATLDLLFAEVAQYVKDNYPDKTFWVDAGNVTGLSNETSGTYRWSTGGIVDAGTITRNFGIGLMMVHFQKEVRLVEAPEQALACYICEGLPAVTERKTVSSLPQLYWVNLGTPSRRFGFSLDKRSFPEARDACASLNGRYRLAILDTLFAEVVGWIYRHEQSKEYWVDVSRPENAESSPLLWGDGQSVEASQWLPLDSRRGDWAARLRYSSSKRAVYLDATTSFLYQRHYLCELVPEVILDWVYLGSPGKLFGFSRTPSWGLPWARRACLRQAGDVSLATLDTHFTEVTKYITDNYPSDQFWVDSTRTDSASSFMWGHGGQPVDSSVWMTGEPGSADTVSVVFYHTAKGLAALDGRNDPSLTIPFICQGNPTTMVIPKIFTACTEDITSTESPTMETPTMGCNATAVKYFNLTSAEIQERAKALQKELQVDTSTLSATIRKKISAKDSRPSAQATGYLGIVLLLIPVIFIVVPDLSSLISHLTKRIWRGRGKTSVRAFARPKPSTETEMD